MTAPRAPRLAAMAWTAGLVLYIAWRAYALSMTCDEAWTALPLPYPGFFSFITPAFIAGLNVHLLNSWAINLVMTLFGEHDFVVRLPALAGGVCYLVASYRLSARLFRSWTVPAAVVLLTANPYLLDFFSIGRGYALGMGFLMLGLAPLLLPREGRAPWHLAWFALAALANLSFAYPFLTALAIEGARAVAVPPYQWRPAVARLRAFAGPALLTLAGLVLTYGQAMAIATRHNEHWWGSSDGFLGGSLVSLATVSLYRSNLDPALPALVTWTVLGVMAGLALAALVARFRSGPSEGPYGPLFTLLAFFAVVWAGLSLEHALFHTPYLIERAVFFMYPVLVLAVLCGVACLPAGRTSKIAAAGLTLVLCAASLYNFGRAANLTHTSTWRNDACSRPFMERILRENYPRNLTRQPIKIAVSHMANHTADYYIRHLRLAFIKEVLPIERLDEADYGILLADAFAGTAQAEAFDVILRCPVNDLVLVRRR